MEKLIKRIQKFLLWLVPEDMHRGCGYTSLSADEDPFITACDGHDEFFEKHVGPVVAGDRKFFGAMLRVAAKASEKSLNRGLMLLARALVYLVFVRTVGVVLYWRLEAKKK